MYNEKEVYLSTLEYFSGDTLATKAWMDKYCLKNNKGEYLEMNPNDMHRRLAKEFARIEKKYPNPLSEETIFNLLKDFEYIIPQGSPMYGIGNDNFITSLSNCFVIGSNGDSDSYGSIMRTDEEQVQLMKRRGGVGHDISHLRPSGSLANNSALGANAGSILYMNRYSNSTREVSQDGRRGALMLSISIKHPDAEKFIDMKLDTTKVTGANISVKITDDFIEAVKLDTHFIQVFPINLNKQQFASEFPGGIEDIPYNELIKGVSKNVYCKKIKARKLWDKIIENAWKSAEPGVLFWDKIIEESPADCYGESWKTVSTNPCFTGDMQLLTSDGYMTFFELNEWCDNNPGMFLSLRNISDTKDCLGKVSYSGEKHTIKLIFEDYNEITCTPDHVFMDEFGNEVKAKDTLLKKLTTFGASLGLVVGVVNNGVQDVYDFTIQDNKDPHWGIVNNIVAHNCGEIPLCPEDSCRLMAINLYSYVVSKFENDSYFDEDLFAQHVRMAQRLMDDLVDLEIEKLDRIINKIISDPEPEDIKQVELNLWKRIRQKAIDGRRTGLGITGEGDMLAALGFRYGAKEATDFSERVHSLLAINSYTSSILLAEERGAFPIWNSFDEVLNPFIGRVLKKLNEGIDVKSGYSNPLIWMYQTVGRRNISNLTIAPTGCLDKNVKIKTNKGDISLGDLFELNGINIDDLKGLKNEWFEPIFDVLVFDETGNSNKISKLYWNGVTEGFKLNFSNGSELSSSKIHKFLVKINENEAIWKSVEELNVGDKILKLQ